MTATATSGEQAMEPTIMPDRPSWDQLFISMAYLVAMKSKDQSTHMGAVIIGPDNELRSTGYNSFPRGINDDCPERQLRPEKYQWFEHAERNGIYNASRFGAPLKGCRLYTNAIPCMDCARAIVQAGIIEVVVDKNWDNDSDQGYDARWAEENRNTLQLFQEAKVAFRFWQGELLSPIRFKRGKIIS